MDNHPNNPTLPAGVRLMALTPNLDTRGWLCELHRDNWFESPRIVQWDVVYSRPDVLRGLHAHLHRCEIYILVRGRAVMKIRDIRPYSSTESMVAEVDLDAVSPCAVRIPEGILHGILFFEESLLLVGFSRYYDMEDEQGVIWNDPGTGIIWPCERPILSDRDRALPSLQDFLCRRHTELLNLAEHPGE